MGYLGDAVSGDIPPGIIFRLIGLKMVWYLVHVVPFALALGVVPGLGRLYRDNEMTVMSACGVGPWRIYKPLLAFGLVLAMVLAWLSLYVSPQVQALSYKLEKVAKQQADLTVLGAGRFNELQKGRLTFYAERLSADKQHMDYLEEIGLDSGQYKYAFWGRFMTPFAALVMLFISVPFVFGSLRSVSAGQRVFIGMLVGFGFYLVSQVVTQMGQVFGFNRCSR